MDRETDAIPADRMVQSHAVRLLVRASVGTEALLRAGVDAVIADGPPADVAVIPVTPGRPDVAGLVPVVASARGLGQAVWLAGALEPPDVPRLTLLRPDALLLDGVSTGRIRAIRAALDARPGGDVTDTVFVRDLVLPVRVGAYASERGEAQRVRFSVEARVARRAGEAHGIGDVFSYDVLADAARIVAAEAHTGFVETLAERVAALILAPPVRSARVRVEKLDLDGIVGVEIERSLS